MLLCEYNSSDLDLSPFVSLKPVYDSGFICSAGTPPLSLAV